MAPKKALMVVTSFGLYPGTKQATGLWFAEATHFYHEMKKAGWEVDIVSPKGGFTPIDPSSLGDDFSKDEVQTQCYTDQEFRSKLGNPLTPEKVNPANYSVIYYAGGHGTVWDFPDNPKLQEIASKIYEQGGIVSSVCHGSAGLLNVKLSNGTLLIKDKQVTGFSNEEEKLVNKDTIVPFLTEDMLLKRGAKYMHGPPFGAFVVADARVVTGQNPGSSLAVAKKCLEIFK